MLYNGSMLLLQHEQVCECCSKSLWIFISFKSKENFIDICISCRNRIYLLQHASGADLGILFINVLTQSGTKPTQSFFEKITSLFSLMSPASPEREAFVQLALKWSVKSTASNKTGHPDLHQKIAQVFWRGISVERMTLICH